MTRHEENQATHPVVPDLLPRHLLPRHRQLPPQPLERPLAQLRKSPVQLLVVIFLGHRYLPHHVAGARSRGGCNGFGGGEAHVAVFVVVHVDFDGAGQGGGGGVVEVGAAPAAVPGGGLVSGVEGGGGGRDGGYQKLEGEYLLAPRRMARGESEALGKTAPAEVG